MLCVFLFHCQMKLQEATEYDDLEAGENDEVHQLKLLDADKFAHGFMKNGNQLVLNYVYCSPV